MMNKLIPLVGALGMLGAAGNASALLIDNFDDAQSISTTTIAPPTQNANSSVGLTTPTNSSFTDREFDLNVFSNPDANSTSLSAGTGALSVAKGPNTTAEWYVEWTNAAGVDFSVGGTNDTLAINLLENNAPFADFELTLTDADGTTATVTQDDIAFVVSGFPIDVTYLLSDFSTAAVGGTTAGLDLENITVFRFYVDGADAGNGVDMQIDFVEVRDDIPPPSVPAPGTIALLGLGLVGGFFARRKRT